MPSKAEILARMGLDTSEFKQGIGQATSEAKGFELSLREIKHSMHLAFAVIAAREFLKTAKEIRKEQEEGGVKLVDDAQLDAIDHASDTIDKIATTVKSSLVSFFGEMVEGIQLFAATLGALSTKKFHFDFSNPLNPTLGWSDADMADAEKSAQAMMEKQHEIERRGREQKKIEKRKDAADKESDKLTYDEASEQGKVSILREKNNRLAKELTELQKIINPDAEALLRIQEKMNALRESTLSLTKLTVEVEKRLTAEKEKQRREDEAREKKQEAAEERLIEFHEKRIKEDFDKEKRAREEKQREETTLAAEMVRLSNEPMNFHINADSAAKMGGTIGRQITGGMRSEERKLQIMEKIAVFVEEQRARHPVGGESGSTFGD